MVANGVEKEKWGDGKKGVVALNNAKLRYEGYKKLSEM